MRPPLALSTMYFQRWPDDTHLAPFFEAGRDMGFAAFELSHILAAGTVAGIDTAAVRITAVHHPCPRPAGFREADKVTASDKGARAHAAAGLIDSIHTAERLAASAVVVHLGEVEDGPARPLARLRFELENRYRAGLTVTPAFQAARRELAERIAAAEPAHLDRAIDSLRPVLEEAARCGIRLGVETGYHGHELPTASGIGELLGTFGPEVLGAWLDSGHVAAQAALGLTSFEAWFEAVGPRWLGVHWHDIVGLRDHLPPGLGTLDFASLAGHLPADAIWTAEVDWYFTPVEVMAGAAVLRAARTAGMAP